MSVFLVLACVFIGLTVFTLLLSVTFGLMDKEKSADHCMKAALVCTWVYFISVVAHTLLIVWGKA